jgi:hypothetical protein
VATSPKQANQYKFDPRQAQALSNYYNPNSPTYSNLLRSLIAAGYSEKSADGYSKNALKWLKESQGEVTKKELVVKAKQVLRKSLSSQDERIAQDTAKFIAKTDHEFSEKTETTVVLPRPIMEVE